MAALNATAMTFSLKRRSPWKTEAVRTKSTSGKTLVGPQAEVFSDVFSSVVVCQVKLLTKDSAPLDQNNIKVQTIRSCKYTRYTGLI